MINRILTIVLIGLSISSTAMFFNKNHTISELEQAASDSAELLENRNEKITTLEISVEQQANTINKMSAAIKQREVLASNHYKSIQSEFNRVGLVETKVAEVITNDERNTALGHVHWAYVNLPADVKRVFDYATGTAGNNGDEGGEGISTCLSSECLRATADERGN